MNQEVAFYQRLRIVEILNRETIPLLALASLSGGARLGQEHWLGIGHVVDSVGNNISSPIMMTTYFHTLHGFRKEGKSVILSLEGENAEMGGNIFALLEYWPKAAVTVVTFSPVPFDKNERPILPITETFFATALSVVMFDRPIGAGWCATNLQAGVNNAIGMKLDIPRCVELLQLLGRLRVCRFESGLWKNSMTVEDFIRIFGEDPNVLFKKENEAIDDDEQ